MVVLMQLVTNLAPIPTVKMVKLDMADHILDMEGILKKLNISNKHTIGRPGRTKMILI
jgi:hypothetical protein